MYDERGLTAEMITLSESVRAVLSQAGGGLTYAEIATRLNREKLYQPRDGLFLAVAQVRTAIRDNPRDITIDRTSVPHRIRLKKP